MHIYLKTIIISSNTSFVLAPQFFWTGKRNKSSYLIEVIKRIPNSGKTKIPLALKDDYHEREETANILK